MAKAVALFSGGLDSTLAIRIMLEQGIEVSAIQFSTYFGCGGCGSSKETDENNLGFGIRYYFIGEEYVQMVRYPKFGWGKNMNPCIDCRIMMLKFAKEYLDEIGGDFIITGEVLGERPMSQRYNVLKLIDKESGLEGRIVRPLSAKLLEITKPELNGIINRNALFDISGRSRKRQYELAKRFNITKFSQPAGGCLLTDENYSRKLRDLFKYSEKPLSDDIGLLRWGRHFRTNPNCKIIVGRDEKDNLWIESFAKDEDVILYLRDFNGPTTLIRGKYTYSDLEVATALTVKYSDVDNKNEPVAITYRWQGKRITAILRSTTLINEGLITLI